jgi:hypothetical protein
VGDQEQIERLQAARYEARDFGYLLFVDEALNIEPLKYQAWAAPAIHGQVTMGRFLAYGESLGETAESGLATLKASLGEDEDSRRVMEIIAWFDGHGMEMWLHEIAGKWTAPIMSYSSDVGAGAYGHGNTAREAAEDAKRKYEATTANESADVTVEAPAAEARAEMPPPTLVISGAGAIPSAEEFGVPDLRSTEVNEVAEKLAQLAPDFRWLAAFVHEPTGEYRGYLIDDKTGEVIKKASGDDFHDAVLELFKETYPPSNELKRE